jgi:Xaa-Pro aminopeptidase
MNRLEQVRGLLESASLDGILISNPDNRYWISGYLAEDHSGNSAGVVLLTTDSQILFTGPTNIDWASCDAPDFEVRPWKMPWEKAIGEELSNFGIKRIGFEPASLSVRSFEIISSEASSVELVPLGFELDRLRWIKSPDEIVRIRRVIEITERALDSAVKSICAGTTERQIASKIGTAFLELGADGAAFLPNVAFGSNSAKPHHRPGSRALQNSDAIVIDIGARLDGYIADVTRTFWLGSADSLLIEIYNVVKEAQLAALETVRAGVHASTVDGAARKVIADAGHGEHFIHGIGHGIGVRLHDGPSLNSSNEEVLEAGNVVTIEPGIYIQGFAGVRIEDVVAVQRSGHEVLTNAPKFPAIG